MVPGTQPQIQSINVISTDPQPLSNTASGGQIIHKITLNIPILMMCFLMIDECIYMT